jgi:YD repeat-containing protein
MRKNFNIAFSLLLSIVHTISFSQSDPSITLLKNVVPPSPDASNLGKYGDWPVDLYTGLPGVEIPLYSLHTKDVKVPLSLSYHPSGIKVGEIASWVGLGWTLQGGGVITRSVRGLPDDEGTAGYFIVRQNYIDDNLSLPISTTLHGTYVTGSAKGEVDTEQDIYMFNALGKSFKLIFKQGKFTTVPFSNIGFSASFSTDIWKVILEDGTTLTFGGTGFKEVNTSSKFATTVGSLTFTASWYLKSIKSAKGEIVNFTYTSTSVRQEQFYSESDELGYSSMANGSCLTIEQTGPKTTFQRPLVSNFYLKTIESDWERLDFDTTSRDDLQGGKKLAAMKVFSKQTNQYVDQFTFSYAYSTAVSGNTYYSDAYQSKRLKLVQVQRGLSGSNYQNWSFAYNTQNLPSRSSYAQDHWGYFNGATQNTTLLPYLFFVMPTNDNVYGNTIRNGTGFFPTLHPLGANREPNASYMQAEMLTRITYPTGGYSDFIFEPNSYPVTATEVRDTTITSSLNDYYGGTFVGSVTKTFQIGDPGYASITLSGGVSQAIVNDLSTAYIKAEVFDSSNNLILSAQGQQNVQTTIYGIIRTAGTYTFKVSTNVTSGDLYNAQTYLTLDATLAYKKSVSITSKLAGGLRVKKIADSDGSGGPSIEKNFVYENPFLIHPFSVQDDYLTQRTNDINRPSITCVFKMFTRNTSTKYSLGSVQGGNIGYGKVTVKYGANAENGSSVSYFSTEADLDTEQTKTFPFPPPSSRDLRRGLLLKKIDYTADLKPVQSTRNIYQFGDKGYIKSFKAGFSTTDPNPNFNVVEFRYYYTYVDHIKTITTSEAHYINNGADSLTVVKNFFYDNVNNPNPVRTETINSKNETIKTYSRTPLEKSDIQSAITSLNSSTYPSLDATASAAIDTMINRNILNQILESETYVNNVLKQVSLTNFKQLNGNIVEDNIYLRTEAGPFEKRVQFSRYDAYGNLTEQSKIPDSRTSYVWGYTGSHVIAEVKNADLSHVFYTGFEDLGEGNSSDNDSHTGRKSKTNGFSKSVTGIANGKYILSYWKRVSSNWVLVALRVNVSGNSYTINISSSLQIDDVRFHPEAAMMTTLTHDPVFGTTSVTDPNSFTTYYEYDMFGRLTAIKDGQRRVLKTYKYNYKQ